jgi:hypothetical protein
MPADQTTRWCCAAARAGCLWAALAALAGCAVRPADAATTGACANRAALTTKTGAAPLATTAPIPVGVPTTRLAFAATATTSAANVESYYTANVLSALAKDGRVLAVDAFSDGSDKPTYYVQAVLKTSDPPSESLAVDILTSATHDQSAAQAIVSSLEKLFDAGSARLLTARSDLSIKRGTLGTVGGQP